MDESRVGAHLGHLSEASHPVVQVFLPGGEGRSGEEEGELGGQPGQPVLVDEMGQVCGETVGEVCVEALLGQNREKGSLKAGSQDGPRYCS